MEHSKAQDKKPRISIIMPSFNAERYIESTLDSILMQSFEDWEAIIMDGGSKDGTVEKVKKYMASDPRIKLYSEPDEGPYHAIHKAAAISSGEFICEMCFSDGYINKDWFKLCVEQMDKDLEISLVWGVPFDMTENNELLGPSYIYKRFLKKEIKSVSRSTSVIKTILKKIDLRHPSSIIRFVRKINGANANSVFHMLQEEEPPQKEAWLSYWLRTGTIFPDLNMFMSRKVFFDCMAPYNIGTRESGDWMQFYFNFNSKGFLSYCLPIPANYGRVHKGQVSEVVRSYNDEKQDRYLKNIADFKSKLSSNPDKFVFMDRLGNPIKSLKQFENERR